MRIDLFRKHAFKAILAFSGVIAGTHDAGAGYVSYGSTITGASQTLGGGTTTQATSINAGSATFTVGDSTVNVVNAGNLNSTAAGAPYVNANGAGRYIEIGQISESIGSSGGTTDVSDMHLTFDVTLNDFQDPQLGVSTGSASFSVDAYLHGQVGSTGGLQMYNYTTSLQSQGNLISVGSTTYEVLAQSAANYFNAPTATSAGRFQIHVRALSLNPVPEPASLVMMTLGGGLGLAGVIRRRWKKAAA